MSSYSRVVRSIWRDADWLALPSSAQRMYLLLLSQPNINSAGVMTLAVQRWASYSEDTTYEQVIDDLAILVHARYVVVDPTTDELMVRTYIVYDELHKQRNGPRSIEIAMSEVLSNTIANQIVTVAATVGVTLEPRVNITVEPLPGPFPALSPHPSPQPRRCPTPTDATMDDQGPKTGIPAADAAAFEDFDQAVNAAVAVRRSQTTTVTNEGGWAVAARRGIISDYGDRIRQLLTEGNGPVNAGRIALGAPPIGPRAPVADTSHRAECECGGSGWVPADEANDRRGGSVVACTIVQPELATVHTLRATS